ncbi:glucose-6-phosphate 1-epimerase [Trifolium repens]|nr:glucose-6-phosphate 1-epimerase [Trifolium repens]
MGDSKAVKDSRLAFGVIKNSNGIDHVFLSTPKGTAQVSLLGAEVTSWRNEKGEELLFRSSKTISEDPRRRLGGISICFPTFASGGRLEQHGFVKNRIWTIEKNPPPLPSTSSSRSNADCYVDLQLESSKELKKFWPHSFMFRLRVCLSRDGDLTLMSRVENTSETAFTFSFAYHTYFSAYEISEIRVENLETLNYKDYLSGGIVDTHQGHALSFDSNVDRFYMSTPESIAVMDHQKKRKYLVRKQGLPDVAVWCPWEAPTWMPW